MGGLSSLFGGDLLKDVVGLLLKKQVSEYADDQIDAVMLGLVNQGLAEPTENGYLVRIRVPDDVDGKAKMNCLLALARGIRRAVEYAAKHGGAFKGE